MILTVGATKGTCGVTTTAMALAAAAAEYGPAWLVEADPSGGSLAGTATSIETAPGLEQLGFDRVTVSGTVLGELAQGLGGVGVVVLPADPYRAWVTVAQPRSPWRDALRQLPGVVVVDVGRIFPETPAWPMVSIADRVVLVSAPTPMGLAATIAWRDEGGRVTSRPDMVVPEDVDLVVAFPAPKAYRTGMVFTAAELPAQLGPRFAGVVPWDASAVELLQRGADLRHRSLTSTGLAQGARASFAAIAQRVQAR
jgi:hypothetical protein